METVIDRFVNRFQSLALDKFFSGVRLPEIKLEPEMYQRLKIADTSSNETVLRALCLSNLGELVEANKIPEEKVKVYIDRLNVELELLSKLKFTDYILIVSDVINFCKKQNIPYGIGRGCFAPKSLVKMANNQHKNIEDVQIGEIVIDHNNCAQKVLDTLTYVINEEILELSFDSGKTIKCTKEHEFFTENRGWVQAQYLTEDDDVREI